MVDRSSVRRPRTSATQAREIVQVLVDDAGVGVADRGVQGVGWGLAVVEPSAAHAARRRGRTCRRGRRSSGRTPWPPGGTRPSPSTRTPSIAAIPARMRSAFSSVRSGSARRSRRPRGAASPPTPPPSAAGPGALQVRRRVEASEPAVEDERLVAPQLLRPVQDDRHALRDVAELVDVGRDRVHAVDPEVPRRHLPAEHLGERQHEPAHAGVDVAVGSHRAASAAMAGIGSTTPCGYCGAEPTTSTVLSSTHAAMASTSAASRRARAPCGSGGRTGGRALWNAAWALSATTISRRRMPRSATPTLAGGLHRAQDRLGAAAGEEARRGVAPWSRSAVQPTTSYWIAPSDGNASVFERVLVQVHRGRPFGDLVHARPTVVDHAERPPVLPADVARPASPRGRR